MDDILEIAKDLEEAGMGYAVSQSLPGRHLDRRQELIAQAAHCFTVAAALRAQAAQMEKK